MRWASGRRGTAPSRYVKSALLSPHALAVDHCPRKSCCVPSVALRPAPGISSHTSNERATRFTQARVVVITSGKGGVGKTTTTANVGMSIARLGYRRARMSPRSASGLGANPFRGTGLFADLVFAAPYRFSGWLSSTRISGLEIWISSSVSRTASSSRRWRFWRGSAGLSRFAREGPRCTVQVLQRLARNAHRSSGRHLPCSCG